VKKGQDYIELKNAGLPVPIYAVFDSSCLNNEVKTFELQSCVEKILTDGSGLVGVRTEPKEAQSILGNYPHYMPLRSFGEVLEAIRRNEREWLRLKWWYLVNEAFLDYGWNAVVKLTQQSSLPGHWRLEGEINLTDNLPLRPALAHASNLMPASKWIGSDSAQIRKQILNSGLLERWLEVSKVHTPKGPRFVFWGMRGTTQKQEN
jgi:hypothetical protein